MGSIMIVLLAIFAGMAGAAFGWLALSLVAAIGATMLGAPINGSWIMASAGWIGALTGFASTVVLILRNQSKVRGSGHLIRQVLTVVAIVAALAGIAFSFKLAGISHLGLSASAPAVEFEIRLPAAASTRTEGRDVQVELRTDHNQALAKLNESLREAEDGRAVLRGRVPIAYPTAERLMVLNLPGQPQRLFKLRLAPNPSASDDFGPWHQVDYVAAGDNSTPQRAAPTEGFAIRYRVM